MDERISENQEYKLPASSAAGPIGQVPSEKDFDVDEASPSKEDLICQLKDLGYNEFGRKVRCDKGKKRGANSRPRLDKGTRHINAPLQKEPLTVYLMVRNKLLKKEVNSEKDQITYDTNYMYVPLVRQAEIQEREYSYVHKGVKVNRTVKHIASRTIDLEKYRFEAMQSIAGNRELTMKEKLAFYHECSITHADTALELFTRWYHISEEDYLRWSYDHWRHDYEIVKDAPLDSLVFNLSHSPGTSEFMPEYQDKVTLLLESRRIELQNTQAYRDARAIYRDRLIGQYQSKLIILAVNNKEYANLSLSQIERIVRKAIPQEEINDKVDKHMAKWLNNKVKETY